MELVPIKKVKGDHIVSFITLFIPRKTINESLFKIVIKR